MITIGLFGAQSTGKTSLGQELFGIKTSHAEESNGTKVPSLVVLGNNLIIAKKPVCFGVARSSLESLCFTLNKVKRRFNTERDKCGSFVKLADKISLNNLETIGSMFQLDNEPLLWYSEPLSWFKDKCGISILDWPALNLQEKLPTDYDLSIYVLDKETELKDVANNSSVPYTNICLFYNKVDKQPTFKKFAKALASAADVQPNSLDCNKQLEQAVMEFGKLCKK